MQLCSSDVETFMRLTARMRKRPPKYSASLSVRAITPKMLKGSLLLILGFPYHALDVYLPKMIRAGERIAICDQLETTRQGKDISERQKSEPANREESKASRMHR